MSLNTTRNISNISNPVNIEIEDWMEYSVPINIHLYSYQEEVIDA